MVNKNVVREGHTKEIGKELNYLFITPWLMVNDFPSNNTFLELRLEERIRKFGIAAINGLVC